MKDSQRESYSFTLRACPSDTNTIELIEYLRSLGRSVANRKIEDALMKTLLSLAKLHSGKYTPEQLRLSCLNSCDALSSHSTYLRQAFNIAEPHQLYSYPPSLPVAAQPGLNGLANSSSGVAGEDRQISGVKADNGAKTTNTANNSTADSNYSEIEEVSPDDDLLDGLDRDQVDSLNKAFNF